MTPLQSRRLNALGLIAISLVVLGAFYDQFVGGHPPCPLCILQRAGFTGAMVGLALNVRFEPRPIHYAIIILSALAGSLVSARQILLHIAPGDGGYGPPLFGMHLYTWALVLNFMIVAGSAAMLFFNGQFEGVRVSGANLYEVRGIAISALVLAFLLILGNGFSTVAECRLGPCPDNPVGYLLFDWTTHAP
jgi:disulfide bond formation protein DsbB